MLIVLKSNILIFLKGLLCANYFMKYLNVIIFGSNYLHIISVYYWKFLYKFLSPHSIFGISNHDHDKKPFFLMIYSVLFKKF